MMDELRIPFKKILDITKAYEGDDGELYVDGESSGPEIDLDEQFVTETCVAGMANQVNKSPVPYLDEHQKRGVLSELGTVVAAKLTPEYHMQTTTKLDKDNPAAVALWKAIRKGKKYGQSIAGHVAELATKVVNGKMYKGFNRIVLDHIANTTKPSWAPSLGTLVAKSLEQDGFDWDSAPEYEGDLDLPFSAHVEKRSKPDPKAGKGYLLLEDLLRRLNTAFGWESYQDKIDEENRDTIALQDIPALKPLFPVGSMSPPTKAYDDEGEEWQGFIQKAVDAVEPGGAMTDIRTLAEVYERLYWLANSLSNRDKAKGVKDGKKTVTRLKSAMAAIAEAMKQTLAKSQPPEPLTYGEPPSEQAQPETEVTDVNTLPDNALTTFDDVVKTGQVPGRTASAEPPAPAEPLTDFSEVAEATEEKIAKRAELPPMVTKTIRAFEDVATNLWNAEADVGEKQKALSQIGKAFVAELHGQMEGERPEEDRINKAVTEAVAPLVGKIENLEAQLAIAMSQKPVVKAEAEEGDEPPLVRKSLPGGRVVLQAARVVKSQKEAPTFVDLVTGRGGLLD